MKRSSSVPAWTIGAICLLVLVGVTGGLLTVVHHSGSAPTSVVVAPAMTTTSEPPAARDPHQQKATPAVAVAPSTKASLGPAASGPATSAGVPHPTLTSPAPPRAIVGAVPVATGPALAAPGTYRYRQAGTLPGTPREGTLVVAPASASGSQTWTRVVGGTVAPATMVMQYNAAGIYLMAPSGSVVGAQPACSFATPVPWPPWPTTTGRRSSGQATCSGAVTSYQLTTQVEGPAPLPLDGQMVQAVAVVNTIVISGTASGSPLRVTLTETDWYSPTLRVPVQTKTHVAGSVVGLSLAMDRTDSLETAMPA